MYNFANMKRKLDAFSIIPAQEYGALDSILSPPKILEGGVELRFKNLGQHKAFLICEGWAFTHRMLPNGTRQIIDIALPGDIVGMRSMILRDTTCKGMMLSVSAVHEVSSKAFLDLLDTAPRLAAGMIWAASRDESLLVERLASLGRRNASERVAHFFLELKVRLKLIGKCAGDRFFCPLSQSQIADALGLTPAHLNRTLRQLREMNLLHIHDGEVVIADDDKMAQFALFEGDYLDQSRFQPAPSAINPEDTPFRKQ